MRHFVPLAISFALFSLPSAAEAADPASLSARQILDQLIEKGGSIGFQKGTAHMRMTLKNKRGEIQSRSLKISVLKGEDGLTKSLVRFEKPADVAGTAFLVHEKKDAFADSWIYLPALQKVRRIAAGNTTGSFFGSDFTFADLMPLPKDGLDQVTLTRLPDVELAGQKAFVVQMASKEQGMPYGRVVTYIHQKHLIPMKIEFFDKKDRPLKVMRVKRVKTIGGVKMPIEITMKNLQKGTETTLELSGISTRAKLTDADFTQEAMQR